MPTFGVHQAIPAIASGFSTAPGILLLADSQKNSAHGVNSVEITSYQRRVEKWLEACFPAAVRSNRDERTHRFLEEALELAQANGCSREDALALVDYVFGRVSGEPDQEVGGVMVTLASLCSVSAINMDEAGERELSRNWERIDLIRAKQQSKPHGSPLPQ